MSVELYPLNTTLDKEIQLAPPFGVITIDRDSVLEGEVTDDLCRSMPCQHDATCQNTWNDFVCSCTKGYKGKLCQEIEFCELHKCPGNATCKNLDSGYDCVTNVTFNGTEEHPLTYFFVQVGTEENDKQKPYEKIIEISYRTKIGGTLLYVEQDEDMYFEIASYKDQLTIHWSLNSDIPEVHRFAKEKSQNYGWNNLFLKVTENKLEAGWKGWETLDPPQPQLSVNIDMKAFEHVFSGKFPISLGGSNPTKSNTIQKGLNLKGATYKGCIGEVRIGDLLLPFFPYEDIYKDGIDPRSHYSLNYSTPVEGCILCFEQDCQNGGYCMSPMEKYSCEVSL